MAKQLAGILIATAALLFAACGDDTEPIADSQSAPATDDTETGTGDDPDSTGTNCDDGPDRTVTPISGVTVPRTHYPEIVVEDEVIAGETIPGFTVPELDIPEQTIDTGCVIEFDAPGGCLGEVVVADTEVPERVMPGYEIPEVVTSDGEVLYEGYEEAEVVLDPVPITGFTIDEVCQVEPEDESEGVVWGVTRWGDTRWGETQWGETQWGDTREQICIEDECTSRVNVPLRTTPLVTIPLETVPLETLPMRILDGTDTQVLDDEDEDETAYLAPADVLFEFDESDLTDEAVPTLEAITAAIDEDFDDNATVTVEGHTDSEGDDDYNQGLSEDRAESVAGWLTDEGGIDPEQISTAGYGETLPVASNDDEEGRAQNRRVVITVTAG